MPSTASDRHAEMRRMPVRGIVRPLNQAAMASDLSVRVAQLRVREAQSFRKGDVLLTFDCERLEAEQAAAEAVHREMKIALDSNVYLDKRGAVGRNDVEVSRARVDKAGADARALKARLRQCVVAAPFDGRVAELTINEHEIPAPGKPFITLVDEAAFEIDVILPSLALKRLAPGQPFTFSVDETGRDYPAKVLRIGAAVDPVSQTVKVIAAFDNRDERVLPGMSGTASFPDLVGLPGEGAGR
jgi:RND family efflux transporter MFP subunit